MQGPSACFWRNPQPPTSGCQCSPWNTPPAGLGRGAARPACRHGDSSVSHGRPGPADDIGHRIRRFRHREAAGNAPTHRRPSGFTRPRPAEGRGPKARGRCSTWNTRQRAPDRGVAPPEDPPPRRTAAKPGFADEEQPQPPTPPSTTGPPGPTPPNPTGDVSQSLEIHRCPTHKDRALPRTGEWPGPRIRRHPPPPNPGSPSHSIRRDQPSAPCGESMPTGGAVGNRSRRPAPGDRRAAGEGGPRPWTPGTDPLPGALTPAGPTLNHGG